jgi:hypothetical protein
MTVPAFQGTGRSVDRSGCITKSPYPLDHDDIA